MEYHPDTSGINWILNKIKSNEEIVLFRTFFLTKNDIYNFSEEYSEENEEITFIVALLEGDYYKFSSKVLAINFELYFYKTISFKSRMFTAIKNVSIFKVLDRLNQSQEAIYVGGDQSDSLPEEVFNSLLNKFPNSTELLKYVNARVCGVIKDYLNISDEAEIKFQNYLNKKLSKEVSTEQIDMPIFINNIEKHKYEFLYDKLRKMLLSEESYSEILWQAEILKIILLIYPKYIRAFTNAPIYDSFSGTDKKPDFMLIDAEGHTDILEIKKPFDQCIISRNTYRNNYIPLKELSGSVMQVEKYAFNLSRWGDAGEKLLNEKYAEELPTELTIKIVNSKGIIILGREYNLTLDQKRDFEVVKRKYKNIIDILSYDDLLNRLKILIEKFS